MSLDTTNWVKYPFSVDGVDFVSMLDPKGSFYPQVEQMPIAILNSFNEDAIRKMIGSVSEMSKSEIQDELDVVNNGATQAILALA
jgi:hypothetical protein